MAGGGRRATLVLCCGIAFDGALGLRQGKRSAGNFPACGHRQGAPLPMDVGMSIVNGRAAPGCAWPWEIHLDVGCGGTLISPQWVLTAAHCGTPGVAYAGLHNVSRKSDGQRRTVIEHHLHPQYRAPTRNSNDLMLLKLASPFDLGECVSTACLPSTKVAAGASCWISGWGTLTLGGDTPDILQEASVNIYADAMCESLYGADTLSDDMVCANGRYEGKVSDACQGDSGGPLVCQEDDGLWFVHGATSWGRGCADASSPGVYARAAFHQDWITEVSGVLPNGEAPVPTPAPAGCPAAFSTGPDVDGDCTCTAGLSCSEGGSPGCTFSYTWQSGQRSDKWFSHACDTCACE